jgi:hypothetical protein
MHALHAEHKARKRGEHVGGGLGSALGHIGKWIWGHVLDPIVEPFIKPFKKIWNIASHVTYPLFHSTSISEHSSLVASAIKQSYILDETKRADFVGDLVRDQELSSKFIDVWVDEHREPPYALITVRGSKKPEDFLIDDLAILGTGRSRNLIQGELSRAVNKYADAGTVEVASHSLGTTLVAEAIQGDPSLNDKIDRIDFYNPATTPLTHAVVSDFVNDPKSHWYMCMTDMVGWGEFAESTPKNLIMLGPKLNPIAAHGLEQWVKDEPETGQLDDEQQANLKDPNAGWEVNFNQPAKTD